MEGGSNSTFKVMNQDFVKLDRFDGTNFTRWQDKMKFLLTALKIFYVLDPNLSVLPAATPEDSDAVKAERKKREEDELVCRGHILNTLSDRLYDLFTAIVSPREIWNALEAKYKTEKLGTDKFVILKYFEFKMIDTKSVLDQMHELQVLVSKLRDLNINIPESFQVGAIIAKLPSTWNDYRKKLLHMTEELTLEQIGKHLRIEEESRIRDGSFLNSNPKVNVNNVQSGSNKTHKHLKAKSKGFKRSKPYDPTKDKKNRPCFHCGKKGHYIRECRFLKNQKKDSGSPSDVANAVEEIIAMVEAMQIGVLTEVHMAAVANTSDWWFDSGATVHVCNDKAQFKNYVETTDGQEVLMGNNSAVKVLERGNIELLFTSGKKLILTNVLYVPEIKKNLVSANLLCKKGIKAVLESDKLILSKGGMFVGKGYSCDGMFKLSINNMTINYSSYIVDQFSVWHGRLAHLNYKYMRYMYKNGLISYDKSSNSKCEVCIQAKMSKKPFPTAQRDSQILDLIHSDICELNGILTRGGKRYFITFVDDHSRYTYVYLMRTKDEAFEMFKRYKSEVENQKEKKVKVLRSDRGGEYFPEEFSKFCEEHGIIHQTSAPYTPQQNGLAERKNRTLVDMVNAMIIHSKLPFNLWGEALLTACHVHNRVPSRKIHASPYELWKGRKPSLNYLKV